MLLTPPPVMPSEKIGSFVGIAPAISPQLARFPPAAAAPRRTLPLLLSFRTMGCMSPTSPTNSLNWSGSTGAFELFRRGARALVIYCLEFEFHCFLVARLPEPTLMLLGLLAAGPPVGGIWWLVPRMSCGLRLLL